MTVIVPADAFDAATLITTAAFAKSSIASVNNFDAELNWSAGVQLRFDGVAKERLQLEIPATGAIDASKQHLLALLGQSMRGPRLMIVDTLRADGTKFTTAETTAAPQARAATNAVAANAVLTGSDVKKFLLGVTRSGIYAVVDIRQNWGWSLMQGVEAGYDLFWDTLTSLFAADFYLAERRGRVAIPVVANTRYTVTGVDTATGLNAFSSTYEPLLPGTIASVSPASGNPSGPYPIFGTPFRVESVAVNDAEVDVRDFHITANGTTIVATTTLPAGVEVSMFNTANGALDSSRTGGLSVEGRIGDRILLYAGGQDVDPDSSVSVVFNEPIDTAPGLASLFRFHKGDDDITSTVTFTADSNGRRVTVNLPATLERGAKYALELLPQIADSGSPARSLGQVEGGAASASSMRFEFQVRAPAGLRTSFSLRNGAIRDMAQSGNVLFYAALEGGLLAYDITNPAAMTSDTAPMAIAPGEVTNYWSVVTDHHGRVYATGVTSLFGVMRSFRVEDFQTTSPTITVDGTKQRGAATLSWNIGATSTAGIGAQNVLSDRPEALPRKVQVAVQDTTLDYEDRAAFVAGMVASIAATDSSRPDGLRKIRLEFSVPNGHPYRQQRITIENLTRGARWSADAYKAGATTPAQKAVLEIYAAEKDRLRIHFNERTYAVITLFGYGVGVYDLNAMESNDQSDRPSSEALAAEQLRLTSATLQPQQCTGQPGLDSGAIADLTFSPEAMILGGESLSVGALESRRGVLDLNLTPGAQQDLCSERAPVGLLFRSQSASGPIDHPRFGGPNGLRAKYRALAGRDPVGRFNAISRYRWSVDAESNAAGERGSQPGERVTRDYYLVAGNEYGLLVVEAGGTPPQTIPSYWPLVDAHLADVIWIPGGAFGVRAIPDSNYATVVDGEGRVLLVDLSRLDERWTAGSGDELFATAAKSLAAAGAYGVGIDDPRIVWRSEPGMANSTLAPIADPETGYVYAGRLLEKVTNVISAIDPRLTILDGESRATNGVVPLGVSGGTSVRGAFRIEAALPGSITESLPGGTLRLAVESERVPGAVTEGTPSGYPPAHLRDLGMQRLFPADLPSSRWQRGFHRFLSDWIVPIADPRAAKQWNGSRGDCVACDRLPSVAADSSAKEIFSTGRTFRIHLEPNQFGLAPRYAYLEDPHRLETRVSTIPADTVRPAGVLVAPQHPPIAGGMLQETTYVHSGEIETSAIDLDAGGRAGWNVIVDRTYRSRTLGWTPFGAGWDSTIFRRLRLLPDGAVEYRDGEGEVWLFTAAGNGEYSSPIGLSLRLRKSDAGWTLT
ncbi:MAG TPA: Ig-like domain-containing protein, partial [Thermoanaerobaculia bacterium]|nr:Ig-like domain-containing protein [Thermoanaerobaculia bacterium]